jgi:hypothetical protein
MNEVNSHPNSKYRDGAGLPTVHSHSLSRTSIFPTRWRVINLPEPVSSIAWCDRFPKSLLFRPLNVWIYGYRSLVFSNLSCADACNSTAPFSLSLCLVRDWAC